MKSTEAFVKAWISAKRSAEIPEERDLFGKLIGSWEIDYVDNETSRAIKGEWHFARVLDGMAVQDVIVLPDFEIGTTIRVYNPVTLRWDVAYCFAGKIMRFEAQKEGESIVLTGVDDPERKWVFVRIEGDKFHWRDLRRNDDGTYRAAFDLFARRIRG